MVPFKLNLSLDEFKLKVNHLSVSINLSNLTYLLFFTILKVFEKMDEVEMRLKQLLGIEEQYARVFTTEMGSSSRRVDQIYAEVKSVMDQDFVISGIKGRVMKNTYPLVESGTTNCIHGALDILKALQTGKDVCDFEEFAIQVFIIGIGKS